MWPEETHRYLYIYNIYIHIYIYIYVYIYIYINIYINFKATNNVLDGNYTYIVGAHLTSQAKIPYQVSRKQMGQL